MTRSNLLRVRARMVGLAVRLVACLAVVALAAACGPLGDDEEGEPTPTRAASPVAAASPEASPPAMASPRSRSSPTARARPDDEDGTAVASPTRRSAADAVEDETPDADNDETPEDADDDTTEDCAGETPTPPVVEDCAETEELPAVQGPNERVTSAEADEGVNLRAGPGADCDLLTTLQPNTSVEILSGPVAAGDFLWVKVEVAGDEGWLAEEFLDPIVDEEEADDEAE